MSDSLSPAHSAEAKDRKQTKDREPTEKLVALKRGSPGQGANFSRHYINAKFCLYSRVMYIASYLLNVITQRLARPGIA